MSVQFRGDPRDRHPNAGKRRRRFATVAGFAAVLATVASFGLVAPAAHATPSTVTVTPNNPYSWTVNTAVLPTALTFSCIDGAGSVSGTMKNGSDQPSELSLVRTDEPVWSSTGAVKPGKTASVSATGLLSAAADYHAVIDQGGAAAITVGFDCAPKPPAKKPTVQLSLDDSSITVGQSATLSWSSTNATGLTASGDWSGPKNVPSGSEKVSPSKAGSYTYELKATGKGGNSSDSVTLTVKQAAPACQSSLSGVKVSGTVLGTSVTYTALISKSACGDLAVNGDSYKLPKGYDGSGVFNASASPQFYLPSARADLVIKKGEKSASVTKPLGLSCGWVQTDVYLGARQDKIVYPTGTHGYLGGKIVNLGKCTPTPPVVVKNATGDFVVSGASCATAGTNVKVTDLKNATAGKPIIANGKVSVTFRANEGHAFSNGKTTLTVTHSVQPKLTGDQCKPVSSPPHQTYNFTVHTNQGSCTVDVPKATVETQFAASIGYRIEGQDTVWKYHEVKAGTYTLALPKVAHGHLVNYQVVVSALADHVNVPPSRMFTFAAPANCGTQQNHQHQTGPVPGTGYNGSASSNGVGDVIALVLLAAAVGTTKSVAPAIIRWRRG